MFSIKLTESINALDGGYVTSTNVQDVVLQTFSGKVRIRVQLVGVAGAWVRLGLEVWTDDCGFGVRTRDR